MTKIRLLWTLVALLILVVACGGRASAPATQPPPAEQAPGQEGAYAPPAEQEGAYTPPGEQEGAYAPPPTTSLSQTELAYAPPGAEDPRLARYPNPIVVYVRQDPSGVIQRWTFYQTGRVLNPDGSEQMRSPDEVKPIFDAVTQPDFKALEGMFAPEGGCPGCVIQRIILYGPDEPVEVQIHGEPANLPPLVQQALQAITALVE